MLYLIGASLGNDTCLIGRNQLGSSLYAADLLDRYLPTLRWYGNLESRRSCTRAGFRELLTLPRLDYTDFETRQTCSTNGH